MPELAETAIYARDLNKVIDNAKLIAVETLNDKFSHKLCPPDAIVEVKRNLNSNIKFMSTAKSLIMTLPRVNSILHFKLGMSGNFQEVMREGFEKHTFWTFKFSNDRTIYFQDPRRFGSVTLQRGMDEQTRALSLGGYNGTEFRLTELTRVYKHLSHMKLSKLPKLSWLLSTGKYTGIGNYMANEALGHLDMNPFTAFKNIKEILAVFKKAQEIAEKSYSKGGFSFGGGYYMLNGQPGQYTGDYYMKLERQELNNRPVYSRYKYE